MVQLGAPIPPPNNAVAPSTVQLSSNSTNNNDTQDFVGITQPLQGDEHVTDYVDVSSARQELFETWCQRTLPPMPSFVGNKVGEDLCVTSLSIARADGFEHPMVYRKRGNSLR